MASLSDILTVAKNIVTAINGLAGATGSVQNITSETVTAQTLITTGMGVLVNFSVTVKGSANGTINNAATTGAAAAANALVVVSDAATGITPCGLNYNLGLVITPGTGQSINVTYYQP